MSIYMAMAHFFSLSFEPIPFLLVDGILTYYKYLPGASVVRVLVRCSNKCEEETCKEKKKEKTNCQLLLLFGTKGMFTSFAGVPACLRVCARRSCASVCVSALYGKVDLVRGVAAVRVFVLAGVPRLSCVWTSVFICGVTRLRGACWCASFHVLSRIEGLLSDHGTPRQEKGVCAWYS